MPSNGPHVKELQSLDMRFILGAKASDHKALFERVGSMTNGSRKWVDDKSTTHQVEWVNDIPLNDSHPDLLVNFLRYKETTAKGKVQKFSWVTDTPIPRLPRSIRVANQ